MKKSAILYMHFDKEFGARQSNSLILNSEGQVDFEKVRKSSIFLSGVERLTEGIRKGYTVCLMCAEAEPLDCHRFGMITPALKNTGFNVKHILKDNTLISTENLENRLLEKFKKKLPGTSRDTNRIEKLKHAYQLLNEKIGYKAVWTSIKFHF